MLEQFLGQDQSALAYSVMSKFGLSKEQAEGFVSQTLSALQRVFRDGKVDFDRLLRGDLSGLTSSMDLAALSQFFGGDAAKAQSGVGAVLETLTTQLRARGFDAESLLSQLGGVGGGLGGALSGLAGKLFGKS